MTTREHFERVRALFDEASEHSVESRRAWLEEECAGDPALVREVEDLLAISDAARNPDDDSGSASAQFPALVPGVDPIAPPPRITDYEILHVIGRGGMGTVYAAEQKSPRRRVALKVMLAGSLSDRARRRFEFEAEILGRLQHPGIAHIYEAGVAETALGPQPFLAMELVDGAPLGEWIAREKPALKRKLELFVAICVAVQHAHERGVIHRDLKPDNILVERNGTPKVLDFGIARAIGADAAEVTRLTEAGAIIGTLSYMSPERLGDDPDAIDTRSDVYSLGVILYEIVAGRRPHEVEGLPIAKAIETIRNADVAPIAVSTGLPRDLSIIVAKSIEKDPLRRYASAAALADDLQRFLRDEAITARPASTLYHVQKLVRRHRALAIGLAAVIVVLAIGLAGTLWQAHNADLRRRDAEREKAIAETERAKAIENAAETKLVAEFQSGLLANLSVDEFGHSLLVELRKDMAENLARVDRTSDENEKTLASFDEVVRFSNPTNVAQRVLAARVFAPAVDELETKYAEKRLLAATLETPLSETLRKLGINELGIRAARRAVDARRAELGDDAPETCTAKQALALVLRAQGELVEAESLARDVLARRRATLGDRHRETLNSIDDLALILYGRGQFSEAETLFREAIAGQRATLGDTHVDTLTSINNLALAQQVAGRLAEAESLYREVSAARAALGAKHPDRLVSVLNLGTVLRDEGKLAEAEPLLREALVGFRETFGEEHPHTLTALGGLSELLLDLRKYAEAEPLARQALAGCRAKLGADHPYTLVSIGNLATVLQNENKLAEAETLFREELERASAKYGDDHRETLTSCTNLALCLEVEGKLEEASALMRNVCARRRTQLGNDHPRTLAAINSLARMLRNHGELAEAEPLFREALAGRRAKLGENHPDTLSSAAGLAKLLHARGELAECSQLLEDTIRLGDHRPDVPARMILDLRKELRDVYRAWHAIEPSAGHDRRADELDAMLSAR